MLLDEHRFKLFLLPRDHLKTSFGVIDFSLFEASKNPIKNNNGEVFYNGDAFFYSHYTAAKSKETFHEIRVLLSTNDKFNKDIGWYPYLNIDKSEDTKRVTAANAERIYLKRLKPRKEPSFYSTSVESTNLGGHYDYFNLDDSLETEKSKDSPEIKNQVRRFWREIFPMFRKGITAKLKIYGTTHEYNGLYTEIEKSLQENTQWTKMMKSVGMEFLVIKKPLAYFDESGNKKAICPKLKTLEEVDALRSPLLMGNREVEAQFYLNPLPDDELYFREDWFKFIDENNIPGTVFNSYLLVDPAFSKRKGAHKACLIYAVINENADVIFRDFVLRSALGSVGIVDEIFRLHRKWSPSWTFVEQYAETSTTEWVWQKGLSENYPIRAEAFKYDERSKSSRILASTDWYMAGKVYFMEWMQNTDFYKQFMTYYKDKNGDDDAPDLSARIFSKDVMIIPVLKQKQKEDKVLNIQNLYKDEYKLATMRYMSRNFNRTRLREIAN